MAEHLILIADDSRSIRAELKVYLEENTPHKVVAEADSPGAVATIVADASIVFTLALVDNRMPSEGDGALAAGTIKLSRPDVVVVQFSGDKSQSYGDLFIQKGLRMREIVARLNQIE